MLAFSSELDSPGRVTSRTLFRIIIQAIPDIVSTLSNPGFEPTRIPKTSQTHNFLKKCSLVKPTTSILIASQDELRKQGCDGIQGLGSHPLTRTSQTLLDHFYLSRNPGNASMDSQTLAEDIPRRTALGEPYFSRKSSVKFRRGWDPFQKAWPTSVPPRCQVTDLSPDSNIASEMMQNATTERYLKTVCKLRWFKPS